MSRSEPLLTPEAVEAAFDWLLENGDVAGAAKGNQVRTEHMVGIVEARQFMASTETSDARRKAAARASQEYEKACEDHAKAEAAMEKVRDMRSKCETVIEAWRSINANERGIRRFG